MFTWVCLIDYFKKDARPAILVYLPRRSLCKEELAANLPLADALG